MPLVLVNLLQYTGTKGGIEIYAKELYRSIGALETPFEFVGYASRELAQKDTSWFPGTVIDSGISGENRVTWALGELFAVSRAARRAGADLIHGPAMFGPLRSGMPTVISMHDMLYFSHPQLMQTKLFTGPVKLMERAGAANAKRIITISEYSSRAIQKYLRYPVDRIDVIPLAGRTAGVPASSGAPRRADLFLAAGQRSPYKDFGTVVRAWATIPEAQRPRLVITGSHGADPLIPIVRELGLEPWVDLKGWVSTEELGELFGTATAFIDSTLATGFSLPALESMMAGMPLLLADTEIFREVGGDAADYVAPGNPAALGAAVGARAGNAARRAELAELGRARAAQHSWEGVARQTLASFERAIAG